jgi:hypothetical protein
MAMQQLENGASLLVQRTKINGNFSELDQRVGEAAQDAAQAAQDAAQAAAAAEAANQLVSGKYQRPVTGIPATDMATEVQTALNRGNTAVRTVNGQTPDASGNVQVAAGGTGTVQSVNGQAPNASGAVSLTAANIPGTVRSVNNAQPDASGNVTIAVSAGSVSSTGITDSTAVGRSLLTAANAAAAKSALAISAGDVSGLGTAATQASTAFASAAQGVKADTALQSIPFGTTAGTAAQGNDPRFNGNVKTVNNTLPDASGNVNIAVSAGSVASTGITDSTAVGRALLTAADAAAQRTSLGLGSAATQASTAFSPAASAAVAVAASRNLTNADAGKTLEVTAAGVTLTVPAGLNLVPGVIVQRHTGGTSIAFAGGATGNGAATTLAVTAQMAAIVPTATSDAYRVAGV